jgi:hypothetical protein
LPFRSESTASLYDAPRRKCGADEMQLPLGPVGAFSFEA